MVGSTQILALFCVCQCFVGAVVVPEGVETPPNVGPKGKRIRPRVEVGSNATTRANGDGGDNGDMTVMLQRIAERLVVLQALDDQQLRRLETLEYKITKLEVQNQEKMDGLRTDLREVGRRMQQVDWSVAKMETNVEAVKVDTTGLRQGQDAIRGLQSFNGQPSDVDTSGKLHTITTSLLGLRGTLATVQRDVQVMVANMTKLDNVTKSMSALRGQLVTKQHFTTAMVDLRRQSSRPAFALPTTQCPTRPDADDRLPDDCWAVQVGGANRSGIYRVQPSGSSDPFYVHCQLETRGGGWTVLQHRNEGAVEFYRSWQDFKHGFGNLAGEFWLGLEKIHLLTNYKVNELLIELQDFNQQTAHAYYAAFAVGSEVEGYPIAFLGSYDGDAGDSLSYHAGHKFSTFDLDNDAWPDGNCAETHTGGWWYNGCDNSNLNGRYLNGDLPSQYEYQGMYWYDWHGPHYSLQGSRISVRPQQTRPPLDLGTTTAKKADKMREDRNKARGVRTTTEKVKSREKSTESPDVAVTEDTGYDY